ncbi:predicted protein [Enterococcus gallinarum EG2]|nr:predicted protein [Enterococcus gallinarum EG2]
MQTGTWPSEKADFLYLVAARKYFTIEMAGTYKKTRKNRWQRNENYLRFIEETIIGSLLLQEFRYHGKESANEMLLIVKQIKRELSLVKRKKGEQRWEITIIQKIRKQHMILNNGLLS